MVVRRVQLIGPQRLREFEPEHLEQSGLRAVHAGLQIPPGQPGDGFGNAFAGDAFVGSVERQQVGH